MDVGRALSLIVVLGMSALVVASGAVVLEEPADRIDEDVALQPNPDNPFSALDEDDDLVIDMSEDNEAIEGDGVNVNAFTATHEVFYIVYEGDTHADVWLSRDSEAVTFVADGEPIDAEASRLMTNFMDASRIHWYDRTPSDVVRGGFARAAETNVGGWDGYYAQVAIDEGVSTVVTIDDDFEQFDAFATEVILTSEEFERLNRYLESRR